MIVVGATTIDNHLFLSAANIQQILAGSAIIALLAIGETIVIITRNVDLSIGSILGISAYATGVLYVHHPNVSLPVVFSSRSRSAPSAARSTASSSPSGAFPASSSRSGRSTSSAASTAPGRAGTRSTPRCCPTASTRSATPRCSASRTSAGSRSSRSRSRPTRCAASGRPRDFYAIGSDPDAARLAGIPVGSRVFLAFVLSGAIAGVTGALWLSLYASVDAIAGVGYEFQVIAAVVVGGVAIFGGSGTVLGAALGALLLYTINTALVVVNVSSFWSTALAGALLLAAIAFDRLDRAARRARDAHAKERSWLTSRSRDARQRRAGRIARGGARLARPPALGGAARRAVARLDRVRRQRLALLPRVDEPLLHRLNVGEIAIIALPLTLIIITGEIDLSVASMLGLTGLFMAELFKHGWPIWPAMIAAIVLGGRPRRVQRLPDHAASACRRSPSRSGR